jgi:hypothetical protein
MREETGKWVIDSPTGVTRRFQTREEALDFAALLDEAVAALSESIRTPNQPIVKLQNTYDLCFQVGMHPGTHPEMSYLEEKLEKLKSPFRG